MEVLGVGDLAAVVYLWKTRDSFVDLEKFCRYSINGIGCKISAEDLLPCKIYKRFSRHRKPVKVSSYETFGRYLAT